MQEQNDLIGNNEYYITKHEDTLIDIARKFGISFADILSDKWRLRPLDTW